MACGVKFAKFMLIFFNTIFFLTGACLLAIGLWVRLDENIWENVETLDVDESDPMLEYAAYFLIAIGAFILIFGFLGCCGAIKENTCMLGTYIFILVIVLLAEIAAGVLILVYRDEVSDEVVDELEDSFEDDYSYRNGKWSAFAETMNFIQKEFECCGIKGLDSYDAVQDNVDFNATVSPALSQMCIRTDVVTDSRIFPATCFQLKDGRSDVNEDRIDCDDVMTASIHMDDCEDELIDFFEKYAIIFIAIALGFACIQIFGLVFAVCLCRVGGKDV